MSNGKIHTTVNLSRKQAMWLDECAMRLKVKRSVLVTNLLKKILVRWKKMQCRFDSVKYQKDMWGDGWKRVHVFFDAVDYEVFTDMRNFFKHSVSSLLAMAIRLHMDEILNDGEENFKDKCDKYHIHMYNFQGKLDNNNICWHTIWYLNKKFAEKLSKH